MQTRFQSLAFTLTFSLWLCSACAPASDPLGPTPGRSDRPRGGPPVPAPIGPDAGPVLWERWSEVPAYRVAIARTASQHMAADHEGEILANEVASAYPDLGPSRTLEPGSIVVERLFVPGASTPEAIFAMVRRAQPGAATEGAWEFLVLDAGGFVTERGTLETCARCHSEAPHDGVFGRAR